MRARLLLVASLAAALAACMFDPENEEATSSSATAITCVAGPRPTTGYTTAPALGDLSFTMPVAMVSSPTEKNRFYVVEKKGFIRRVTVSSETGAAESALFADISGRINAGPNEAGLLGFALHPDFADNGTVILSYTKPSTTSPANLRSVIARAKTEDGGLTLDASSIEELLELDQPYANHNGGHVAFGLDGYLYASFGDGGSGGDPRGNGQNKDVFFGKILRIDVDRTSDGKAYAIPSDNPFANSGGKPEIYAYGLRNTWRFSFDRLTGELWAGDVGQNKYEEIDRIQLGGNYGWGVREGMHCYGTAADCNLPGAIDPVVEYDHTQGFSVTGGFVYRGAGIPELRGQYIFGDFGSGKIWSIPTRAGAAPEMKELVDTPHSIASFAEDRDGELYVLDYGTGKIRKLVQTVSSEGIPTKLSATGCFLASDPRVPAASLIPYDVNSPLWSDAADKHRYMSLPPGTKIKLAADGHFDFPIGTILVKEFRIGGKRIESRLFMRHTDGSWGGYTYEWKDDESDAVLLEGGKVKKVGGEVITTDAGDPVVVGGQQWTYPSRAQCMGCHNAATGITIGPEVGQLNSVMTYPDGTTQNQLEHLNTAGAFDPSTPLPTTPLMIPSYKSEDPAVTLEQKARAYLHANCAYCHRPQGPGRGGADLRFSRSFAAARICNRTPETGDLGVEGAKILVPGAPEKSIISLRMHALDSARMPAIGTSIVDDLGTSIVDSWISSITSCP